MSRESDDDRETADEISKAQRPADRLLSDMMLTLCWVTTRQQKTWRPATDVYETDDSIIIKVEIAGMVERDFTISLSNRSLAVTGTRCDPDAKLAYQQLEIPYGHFRTEVFLPYAVEHEAVTATYKDGFLTIFLPKVKPHHVPIADKDENATPGRKGSEKQST
jgi:HSP20 family protein